MVENPYGIIFGTGTKLKKPRACKPSAWKKSANGLVGTLGQGLTLNQGLGDPDPSTQGHMGGHWLYVLSVKLSIQVGPGLEIYAGLMFTTCKAGVCRVSVPNVNGRTVEAKQRRWLRREKRGYEYWLGTLSSPPAKSPSAVHCQSSGDYIIVVEMPVLLTAALGQELKCRERWDTIQALHRNHGTGTVEDGAKVVRLATLAGDGETGTYTEKEGPLP
ncbi:hypothetical protein B0H14DRAFT_2608756 [Mycena olivaceomarginata]|nr:hypothetical protein B0H14DRAFT_2608756 [Mycena olivaceomarginata]